MLTPKENDLIHAYEMLMEKLAWLDEKPGRTRRDYQAALRSELHHRVQEDLALRSPTDRELHAHQIQRQIGGSG